ncbi:MULTISPECIES: antA/AntB antirepressor family protein [Nitrosomonas]|uniref:AntA/AntB antirepressor n=1 Tax=Nitrosomonas communis TaxID=44574 RepID=A0A0F7KH52_9PROT|nr:MULTISPECIES: antA/AntB antirepressor family protein [Nitrosomonas]AKH38167.1 hypothetical protein AAW31_10750 [Nitrosomonas communis]TYP69985.1 AntA/AntB antirepressor [Nitrosomonas communis]UVS60122.1 antA/AntB antirepressor family protein [Nitrosomonas sp. PLL12]
MRRRRILAARIKQCGFFCASVRPFVYGRAEQGAARLASASLVFQPVQFPPTMFGSVAGGSYNELEAHIMTHTDLVTVFTSTIQHQSIQLCNARDLHQFLESQQQFANWIKNRIEQYGFVKDEDYLGCRQK